MDATTVIISAIVLGIADAAKPLAERTVHSLYNTIKDTITRKYHVGLNNFLHDTSSQVQKHALEESLEKSEATSDDVLLDTCKKIIDEMEIHEENTSEIIGIDIEDVKAAYFRAKNINTQAGVGLRIKKSEFTDGITVDNINTGKNDDTNPKE